MRTTEVQPNQEFLNNQIQITTISSISNSNLYHIKKVRSPNQKIFETIKNGIKTTVLLVGSLANIGVTLYCPRKVIATKNQHIRSQGRAIQNKNKNRDKKEVMRRPM